MAEGERGRERDMTATWSPPDGTPYRPSNGTDGMIFEEGWCAKCAGLVHVPAAENDPTCKDCPYLSASFWDVDPPRQVWVWRDGKPTCPKFRPLPPGPDDPPPFDPRQKTFDIEEATR